MPYGGQSFVEDNQLAGKSLALLCLVIIGHTDWTNNVVFAHINRSCHVWGKQKPHATNAPYNASDETDNTEQNAREKKIGKIDRIVMVYSIKN